MPLERVATGQGQCVMVPAMLVHGSDYWNAWISLKNDIEEDWSWSNNAFVADFESPMWSVVSYGFSHYDKDGTFHPIEWDPTIRF